MTKSSMAVLLLLPGVAWPQVNVGDVLDQVRSGVKPDEAMAYMRRVYSTDRWFNFPKFQETAEYLKQAMAEAGLQMQLIDYVPCYRSEAGTGSGMGFAYWK